jgi:hypothetical protein
MRYDDKLLHCPDHHRHLQVMPNYMAEFRIQHLLHLMKIPHKRQNEHGKRHLKLEI